MSDAETLAYPVDNVNRVKRRHDRGFYDHETVHALLDAAALCHVSYVIDGLPYCTPTLFWREGTTLYWHGSSASRMLRNQSEGQPACLTVTHLDSLVLARCGFNHSADYRSVMAFGHAKLIEDPAEKEAALVAMVDRLFPARTADLRQSSVQEIKATAVVAMEIERGVRQDTRQGRGGRGRGLPATDLRRAPARADGDWGAGAMPPADGQCRTPGNASRLPRGPCAGRSVDRVLRRHLPAVTLAPHQDGRVA